MMKWERVLCLVLDGCGAGSAPDAEEYGDVGENEGHTLYNVYRRVGKIEAPLLERMGFFRSAGVPLSTGLEPEAVWGRLREVSAGKDSITGHWEMMGIHLARPLPTYPHGFPDEVIKPFEERIGMKVLGNYPASGTEIIQELGEEHIRTGRPIVYTSADSVFQIACHESVVPLEKLYEMCRIAREILKEPHHVGRVIARPFTGDAERGFVRTENRRDFPLPPPPNLIDKISVTYGPVFGIGIIPQIFAHRGFREVPRTQNNRAHFEMVRRALKSDARFIWANFEDFDMLYGHRNDPEGFARALKEFDEELADILAKLSPADLLLLTADHGNDPTTPSTDHTREFVPFCAWSPGRVKGVCLGDLEGFWQVGAAVADALGVPFDVCQSPLKGLLG
jgi:phosphopentomutase